MELFVCLIANVMPKTNRERVKMLTLNSASSTDLRDIQFPAIADAHHCEL
jgi:DNA uptake protein ComE-like DNA-binding protein